MHMSIDINNLPPEIIAASEGLADCHAKEFERMLDSMLDNVTDYLSWDESADDEDNNNRLAIVQVMAVKKILSQFGFGS